MKNLKALFLFIVVTFVAGIAVLGTAQASSPNPLAPGFQEEVTAITAGIETVKDSNMTLTTNAPAAAKNVFFTVLANDGTIDNSEVLSSGELVVGTATRSSISPVNGLVKTFDIENDPPGSAYHLIL